MISYSGPQFSGSTLNITTTVTPKVSKVKYLLALIWQLLKKVF